VHSQTHEAMDVNWSLKLTYTMENWSGLISIVIFCSITSSEIFSSGAGDVIC
jgi:hypothetical protein